MQNKTRILLVSIVGAILAVPQLTSPGYAQEANPAADSPAAKADQKTDAQASSASEKSDAKTSPTAANGEAKTSDTNGEAKTSDTNGEAKTSDTNSEAKTSDTNGEAKTSDTNGEAKNKVLQGGVNSTALPFQEGLARIGVARQVIQDSCMLIMQEATRKDTVVMRGPNVLPGGVVIPALGGVGGVMQMGEMPMRKKKLERWMTDNEQNITALQTYVDGLIIPQDNTQAQTAYSNLREAMQTALSHMEQLKELCDQKRLLNAKIGREALSVHDAMSAIEKSRSQLMLLLPAKSETGTAEK